MCVGHLMGSLVNLLSPYRRRIFAYSVSLISCPLTDSPGEQVLRYEYLSSIPLHALVWMDDLESDKVFLQLMGKV